MSPSFSQLLCKRPLLFDGAMGTMIEALGAGGGCNEELCLSRPELVAGIHRAYLATGADVIMTNTFGGTRLVLGEHGLEGRVEEINRAAVAIARCEAEAAGRPSRPRFVAGEMGPTSKLPTLGHISFADLSAAFEEQVMALLGAGVDLVTLSTFQDPLQVKAALAAAKQAMERSGRRVPVIISVTVERSGTMLLGTEPAAALAVAAPYRPFAFGINCATGPEQMEEHLHALAGLSPLPIACRPNAGMPENVGGRARYSLPPEAFGRSLAAFVHRFGLSVVGGCCGTTPEHIAALARELMLLGKGGARPKASRPWRGSASSLFRAISLDQEPRPFLIAEQTNVSGSKSFRDLLLAGDFDAMAEAGREVARASHALDVSLARPGRDERADLVGFLQRLALKADAAIMVDSTSPEAIEAALEVIPGRAIINSINLEDGGEKARRLLDLAARFGAAVVALAIDERGMARTVEDKCAVAKRLVELAADHGLSPSDLFLDPLTFTLASGDPALRDAGRMTLEGLRAIKREIPGARTILGVSNISFGLPPAWRRILTSLFLDMALDAGLDAAIVNPAKIVPLEGISEEDRELCRRLILGDLSAGDPLAAILAKSSALIDAERAAPAGRGALDPREELRSRVLEGRSAGIGPLLDRVLEGMEAAKIVNEILLPAMQEVGGRFGEGRLPLPFVLQSAEAMRAAIDHLAPRMGQADAIRKGTIVLATVRGDVHDIGKNLVDAILSNNGFRVVNLGIRQAAAAVAEAANRERADAIGLSGLLVSSTEVMREDLEIFRGLGMKTPVLCGGAALTPSFVEGSLQPTYPGRVYYCQDAFAGLKAMEDVVRDRREI